MYSLKCDRCGRVIRERVPAREVIDSETLCTGCISAEEAITRLISSMRVKTDKLIREVVEEARRDLAEQIRAIAEANAAEQIEEGGTADADNPV
jgi:N-methylhydantoinase B/oxoprolinase/acetone carboxylase alpha subunit